MPRNVPWKIPSKFIKEATVGKRVLEPVSCDKQCMLQAAFNKSDCDMNKDKKLADDENEGI